MSLSTVPTDPTLVRIYVAGSDEPTRDFFGERAAWVSLSGSKNTFEKYFVFHLLWLFY